MNKYHAISTFGYASKREANRATELKILQKGKLITDLQEQVRFDLLPLCIKSDGKKERGVYYVADFVYRENGIQVVEDVKGIRLPEYILKRKMMLFFHGITIKEVL